MNSNYSEFDGRISILICTVRPSRVLSAVDAVRNQTLQNWELLVVDQSHSGELGVSIGQLNDSRIRHIVDDGIGKSRALNIGISQARGQIVACTDDDCIPRPDWVAALLAAYDTEPTLAMVGGPVHPPPEHSGNNGQTHCPFYFGGEFSWQGGDGCSDYVLNKTVHGMMGANISYRRTAFLEKVGAFDTNLGPGTAYPSGEDRDISIRVWRAGLAFSAISSAVVEHRYGTRTGSEVLDYLQVMHWSKGALAAKHTLLGDRISLQHFLRQEGLCTEWTPMKAAIQKDLQLGSIGPIWPVVRTGGFICGMLNCRLNYDVDPVNKLLFKRTTN
ncbi:MAG: glycosyltransferase family 2 protein [Candidatus Obscuribacterales bacterium]|nr:glycosyltransferase family 2 protein [Candidatus Obscuribacterales bacterium]